MRHSGTPASATDEGRLSSTDRHRVGRSIRLAFWLVLSTPTAALAAPTCEPAGGLRAMSSLDIAPAGRVLAPWTDETPRELRSVEFIDGREALRADLHHWSPVAVDSRSRVAAADFDAVEVWLRSSLANPPLSLSGSPGVVCPLEALVDLPADSWTRLQVPLESLGYDGSEPLGRLRFKSRIRDSFTVWVSGWRLIETGVENTIPAPDVEAEVSDRFSPSAPSTTPADGSGIDPRVWQHDPGVTGVIADRLPAARVRLDADGSDRDDDTRAFRQILAQTRARGAVIDVPAGTFFLSDTLRLGSRQVLRGAGPGHTRLVFTRSLNQGVEIGGGYPAAGTEVRSAGRGRTSITVEDAVSLRPGLHAVLTQPDDATSQVVQIARVEPDRKRTVVILEEPLNATFPPGARLQPFSAAEFAGVEGLSLDIGSPDVRIGDMILLRGVSNSWVRDVVSRNAFGAHVFTRQTYHCEIRDSVFDDATGHHDGKQGYGVDLANATTACLVENNALRRLRHAILLQEGANGNVIARNHSAEPRHTNFAVGGPGDISFHGAANANLIEANVVERIHVGDAGAVGPRNAVFRNCLTRGPLTLENAPAMQYLSGNAMYGSDGDLVNTLMPPVLPQRLQARPYLETGQRLFGEDGIAVTSDVARAPVAIGNWHAGQRWSDGKPDAAPVTLPVSLYRPSPSPIRGSAVETGPVVFPREPISGYWQRDCDLPAVRRLDNLDVEVLSLER